MTDPMTAIPPDELTLAQLACAKLAGLVEGTLSIGLPAVFAGVPDPHVFLANQFRVMTGFALVLHSVSGTPRAQQDVRRLRDRSRQILDGLEQLHRCLIEQRNAADDPLPALHSAQALASNLCDAIGDFAVLIKLDRAGIAKIKGVVLQVFEAVENLNRVSEPLTK